MHSFNDMNSIKDKLDICVARVREKLPFKPRVALTLGSGLGSFAAKMDVQTEIAYKDLPGFPVSTVDSHDGKFLFGTYAGVPLVAMAGRVHYYEGYDIHDVVMPVRLMGLLGARRLLLTNAAGGIDLSFRPGDLMMITDHITSFVPSPLIGQNVDAWGTRFPDMSRVYSPRLMDLMREAAAERNVPLREGVYLQTTGPQFETPAEIKMFRSLGASAVGMSTAVEAVAARHLGMEIAGISCISNMAAGISDQPLTHVEVEETTARVEREFRKLVGALIEKMGAL